MLIVNEITPLWLIRLQSLIQSPELLPSRQLLRARYSPELAYGRHFSPPSPQAKPAAVMVMLQLPSIDADWKEATIPLTVRPNHLPDHPGQISFPGGRVEFGEDHLQAAVREFEEELGVSRFPGTMVDQLQPIWVFNSDYWLVPFLSVHLGPIDYRPCDYEVARLIHMPVNELLHGDDRRQGNYSRGSVHWRANAFRCGEDLVWGATGIVLGDLAAILRELASQEDRL